ncbi:tRNA (adenine(22)-N(1))-methyltransferase [Bacillus infantis]|uniref:tRNA (adenine(22)-N(1))-methyltransferase n=1 Tax=Bacillus infantis TaxID=324767 RepID=UPI003CEF8B2B
MNTEQLSQRLAKVAEYIPDGAAFADIGSDHAYLPCHVVSKGKVPFAVAGEVAEGPFQSARNQVIQEGLGDKIAVRKGNGLEVVERGEVDCVAIAGMGGALIASILEEGKEKLSSVKRLVLQPNISAISIRKWLVENGWELIEEDILEEDGKIYEILVAEHGEPLRPYKGKDENSAFLFGPFLTAQKTDTFQKKWQHEMKNWQRILQELDKAADSEETRTRRLELGQKISMAEEAVKSEKS